MSNEEKNKPAEGSGDLKARLSFGAKSRRAQLQEEERRKAEEAAAAEKAAQQKRQRDEQFSLAGSGPAEEAWQPVELAEDELKKLEALPSEGRTGRNIVIAVGVVIGLILALGAGYFIGKAFFGRDLENRKVDEAASILSYVEEGRASYFEAVENHRKAIDEITDKMGKLKDDPVGRLRELHAFLKQAQTYVEQYPPVSARDIFDANIYNAAIVPEVVAYVQAIGRMYTMTDRLLDELPVLNRLGTGEEGSLEPKPMPATLVYEPDPQGEGETKIPWNKGEFVQIDGKVFAVPTEDGSGSVFKIPVKKKGAAAAVDVETGRIVEIDAWPVIRRLEDGYRMALLERAQYSLTVLKEASDKVNWKRLKTRLDEFAQKDKYFTF